MKNKKQIGKRRRYTMGVGAIAQGIGAGVGAGTGASLGSALGAASGVTGAIPEKAIDVKKKSSGTLGGISDMIGMYGAIRGGDKGADAVKTAGIVNNLASTAGSIATAKKSFRKGGVVKKLYRKGKRC
jgi:hypothetical protein